MASNVTYTYRALGNDGEYVAAITQYESAFDVIVIDGRERVECARRAPGALKDDGVIIWDNTERERYQEGFDYLAASGFKKLDFWGLGPVNAAPWCTSVFYRNQNCLGI